MAKINGAHGAEWHKLILGGLILSDVSLMLLSLLSPVADSD
jgi:hypothetical protein